MSKKGKRLREFEKKNRIYNITDAQREREERQKSASSVKDEKTAAPSEGNSKAVKKKSGKKSKASKKRRLIIWGIMLVVIASVGFSAVKIIQLKHEKDMLLDQQQELLETKEDMTEELEHINTSSYIEQQVRKELKMIKDSEILFITSENQKEEASKEQEAETDTQDADTDAGMDTDTDADKGTQRQ